jgi:spore maturation protein CgeB
VTQERLRIVVFGLSITSSWGNGHATTYRAFLRQMAARGHHITFFERDVEWYRENRDLTDAPYCDIRLYGSVEELVTRYATLVSKSDVAIVGSYVPDGIRVARCMVDHAPGVKAFYDIDTPVTISDLRAGRCQYLKPELIPKFDLYLSFTGGPILQEIENRFGAGCARLLACSVDPELYYPQRERAEQWELGYLGTYSEDRQPKLDALMVEPARTFRDKKFAVAGSLYPNELRWPANVDRIDHLPPREHRAFYNSQRYTLNVTRQDMVSAGYSPSVRLFEAAACGTPIISDRWAGLETFFEPGREILLADDAEECCKILRNYGEAERRAIGERARRRVLAEHSAAERARQLEGYLAEVRESRGVNVAMTRGAAGKSECATVAG